MRKHSFTLIEMLIVVVIIGILAAALIPRLQSVQARARDTKRKADIHQIATALEIYKEDNGNSFQALNPNNVSSVPINATDGDTLRTTLERYMTAIPTDSNTSPWVANDTFTNVTGYLFVPLRLQGQDNRAFLLGARTESDGSSSNWVTLAYGGDPFWVDGNNGGFSEEPGDTRIGGLLTNRDATLYRSYMCTTTTLWDESSPKYQEFYPNGCQHNTDYKWCLTANNGKGTCFADKADNELRYIYVN